MTADTTIFDIRKLAKAKKVLIDVFMQHFHLRLRIESVYFLSLLMFVGGDKTWA